MILAPQIARADAIDSNWRPPECGEPPSCPDGASPGQLGHSSCPSGCAPNMECQSDADCTQPYGEGSRCVPTRFCLVTQFAGPAMMRSIVDACDPSGPCGSGERPPGDPPECSEVSRCVSIPRPREEPAEEETAQRPAEGGCAGCAVSGGSIPNAVGIALAFTLGSLAIRRSAAARRSRS